MVHHQKEKETFSLFGERNIDLQLLAISGIKMKEAFALEIADSDADAEAEGLPLATTLPLKVAATLSAIRIKQRTSRDHAGLDRIIFLRPSLNWVPVKKPIRAT
ncbi:hypothetical protein NDU88_009809 [Pleurodeles waltl]|uniref:Uncharacterized protein n=1 Tax=Pleurodeles waltl TaxID=8319 RepID=A0AAV7PT54_PLEWA|nr:hypothetical protein NDU88_009809 [Pleurodeles waltl]